MHMIREFKLYPTKQQAATLESWLRRCCWIYNRALEQRIKAYKRRKGNVSFPDQCKMLTGWRQRMPSIEEVPQRIEEGVLRRLDKSMKAFFGRLKAGERPGFPRFKASHRFNSFESIESAKYIYGTRIRVPKLGKIRARGDFSGIGEQQPLLRIIRRASGWYAQVLIDAPKPTVGRATGSAIGIDVGLNSFAAMNTGETIDNPRWARRSQRQLAHAQRRVSHRQKGSKNRRKAVKRLQRAHERIAAQRKDFCHQLSRRFVNENDLIAAEKLNIKGLARMRCSRSVMDAGWNILFEQLAYKAENAGRKFVQVDPRGTSQECPECGTLAKKDLSQRTHNCPCGLSIDRDVAAARVILARALNVVGATECGGNISPSGKRRKAVPVKHEVLH